ncbi:MAG: heat shock protein HspQ [Proteobacteria bacterium]|nr:heat shock protein HspQ [Pseudomonadota bacterium]
METTSTAKFNVGQVIHHKLFDYRGIIVDIDPQFQQSEQWYQMLAKTNPPKDKPWYHVLVDDTDYITYVAEQNLEEDEEKTPINHPDLYRFFEEVSEGIYRRKDKKN